MVGERGFEPPTPWSRTSFSELLKSIEIVSFQLFYIEWFVASPLKTVALNGSRVLSQLQIRLQPVARSPEILLLARYLRKNMFYLHKRRSPSYCCLPNLNAIPGARIGTWASSH